jgi:hypothetical protein
VAFLFLSNFLAQNLFAQDSDVVFKKSEFASVLKDKIAHLKKDELAGRIVALANEVFLKTGLNYKVRLKTENRNWTICSNATNSKSACKTVNVAISDGTDTCGKFGLIDVLVQLGSTWVVATETTNFRLSAPEYFTPDSVLLTKANVIKRFWPIPQGFKPKYLSADLTDIFASLKLDLKLESKLPELFVRIQENGRVQFVELPKNIKNFIAFGDRPAQKIKDLDGTEAELNSPSCQ